MHVTEIVLIVFPALMIFAAASDFLTMTISNRLCLLTAAAFPVIGALAGLGPLDLGLHAAVGAAMLVLGFGLFAAGWIGGGDAKLAAAIALWMGPSQALAWILVASMFGGTLTGLLLGARALPLPAGLATRPWAARLHAPTTGVPYGIALAAAALVLYPHSAVFAGLAG
ncbi:MAG TPA: prepilin peptidase [Hyphomicrobiales bacterium]|nr:prepilin peptidase [Hyphomicrobiales bacterium]